MVRHRSHLHPPPRVAPLNEFLKPARAAERDLARLDRFRETGLASARRLVRSCAGLIRGLHRGEWDEAAARQAEQEAHRVRAVLKNRPEFALHGALVQALGEYAEAHLFRRLLEGRRFPDHRRLEIPAASYVHGISDVVGEARRRVLDSLTRGDLAAAERAFEQMEKIYEALCACEYPEGLLPVKQKRDAARGLIERTRGELLTAKRSRELEQKIDGVRTLLDEAEGRVAKKRAERPSDDLDVDKAWSKE